MVAERTRFLELEEAAQARWLDPAEVEFCEFGFAGASLNRILKVAEVSKGRSYHYFKDKAALFRAVVERRFGMIEGLSSNVVHGCESSEEYWAEVTGMVERLVFELQRSGQFAALVRTLHDEEEAKRAFCEPLGDLRKFICGVIGVGQRLGAVRDDLPADLLGTVSLEMIVSVDRWFAQNCDDLNAPEVDVLSERALNLLIAPLLPSLSRKESQHGV